MKTSLTFKKGNTTYRLDKGQKRWVVFERIIQRNKMESSIVECLSININTHEIHCNRTGKESFGFKTYMNLMLRIEKLFNISSLRDFAEC